MPNDYVRMTVQELAKALNLPDAAARTLSQSLPRVRGLDGRTKLYVPLAFLNRNVTRSRHMAFEIEHRHASEKIRAEKRAELHKAERAKAREEADRILREKLKGEAKAKATADNAARILAELAAGLTQSDMFADLDQPARKRRARK